MGKPVTQMFWIHQIHYYFDERINHFGGSWRKLLFAKKNRDRRYLIEGVIISIAMGLVAGGLVFGFSLFDTVSFEDDSIKYTFISLFLSCFFSGSIDTLLELLKQASSILNLNKIA